MRPGVSYFITLTPDDFSRKEKSAGTQWMTMGQTLDLPGTLTISRDRINTSRSERSKHAPELENPRLRGDEDGTVLILLRVRSSLKEQYGVDWCTLFAL